MSEDICDRLVCFNQHKQCLSSDLEVEAAAEITRLREDLSGTIKRMSKLDFERTAAELERDALREENARVIRENKVAFEAVGGVVKANDKLKEENARLREALGPFAEMLKGNYSHQSDDMPIKAGANQYDLVFVFTLGDLRAARAAILGDVKAEAACPELDEAP